MTENGIKEGDKVRFTGEEGPWFERQIINGDEGVVVGKGFYEDELCVRFSIADDISVGNLELVESQDPKAAFLTELQALLKRYDAKFSFYDVYDMSIEIGDESIDYGFLNAENSPNLTPDNIFNYDKD